VDIVIMRKKPTQKPKRATTKKPPEKRQKTGGLKKGGKIGVRKRNFELRPKNEGDTSREALLQATEKNVDWQLFSFIRNYPVLEKEINWWLGEVDLYLSKYYESRGVGDRRIVLGVKCILLNSIFGISDRNLTNHFSTYGSYMSNLSLAKKFLREKPRLIQRMSNTRSLKKYMTIINNAAQKSKKHAMRDSFYRKKKATRSKTSTVTKKAPRKKDAQKKAAKKKKK
jgi:hypothetical protein